MCILKESTWNWNWLHWIEILGIFYPQEVLKIFDDSSSGSSHHIFISSPGGLYQTFRPELECFSMNGRWWRLWQSGSRCEPAFAPVFSEQIPYFFWESEIEAHIRIGKRVKDETRNVTHIVQVEIICWSVGNCGKPFRKLSSVKCKYSDKSLIFSTWWSFV